MAPFDNFVDITYPLILLRKIIRMVLHHQCVLLHYVRLHVDHDRHVSVGSLIHLHLQRILIVDACNGSWLLVKLHFTMPITIYAVLLVAAHI